MQRCQPGPQQLATAGHTAPQPDPDRPGDRPGDRQQDSDHRGRHFPDGILMAHPRLRQRGQAIVLIAIMLAVLVGMAALAIDGAPAYSLRRDLQEAVDAAALAAGDTLQQSGSYTQAEQAATTSFGKNLMLYTAPARAPGYG